jgi:hypothetical protein
MNSADTRQDSEIRATLTVDREDGGVWGPFVFATHLLIETPQGARRIVFTLPQIQEEPADA